MGWIDKLKTNLLKVMINSKFRKLKILSFVIIGCFAIFLFIKFCVLSSYDHKIVDDNCIYSDLTKKYSVIKNNDIYNFMNYTFFNANTVLTDSLEFTTIDCLTIDCRSKLRSYIISRKDTLLNFFDKLIMKSQLSDEIYLWDNKKLINARCITPKDIKQITSVRLLNI